MSYTGTLMNESPVISGCAGARLGDAAFLAVAYDTTGAIQFPAGGEVPLGLLVAETENIDMNDRLTVQIKDVGGWKAASAFTAGTELTSDVNGLAKAAASGEFILAIALEPAATAGQIVKVQITKSGYKV